jgi:hypothetical protein
MPRVRGLESRRPAARYRARHTPSRHGRPVDDGLRQAHALREPHEPALLIAGIALAVNGILRHVQEITGTGSTSWPPTGPNFAVAFLDPCGVDLQRSERSRHFRQEFFVQVSRIGGQRAMTEQIQAAPAGGLFDSAIERRRPDGHNPRRRRPTRAVTSSTVATELCVGRVVWPTSDGQSAEQPMGSGALHRQDQRVPSDRHQPGTPGNSAARSVAAHGSPRPACSNGSTGSGSDAAPAPSVGRGRRGSRAAADPPRPR